MNNLTFDAYIKGFNIFGLEIRFYAIFILVGALLALLIASFRFKNDGYKFDTIENLFYCAFPAGIIGARIWYVIAEWGKRFNWNNFGDVFAIWDGGLAIQGGVILGALVGILFIKFFRKDMPIRYACDNAVPGILVAQAIGRWGNFFNQEVYGMAINENGWNFLPNFILNQMKNGEIQAGPNNIVAPLFLVEALINLAGFFLLMYGLKAVLGKKYVMGDAAFGYFIWYGIVRTVMEPLRNSDYKMGSSVMASRVMAIMFIIFGIICIIINHVYPLILKKMKEKQLNGKN